MSAMEKITSFSVDNKRLLRIICIPPLHTVEHPGAAADDNLVYPG